MKKYTLAIILILSGCTGTNQGYQRPNTTKAQVDHDKQLCDYEAQLATANTPYSSARVVRLMNLKSNCMRLKGYK